MPLRARSQTFVGLGRPWCCACEPVRPDSRWATSPRRATCQLSLALAAVCDASEAETAAHHLALIRASRAATGRRRGWARARDAQAAGQAWRDVVRHRRVNGTDLPASRQRVRECAAPSRSARGRRRSGSAVQHAATSTSTPLRRGARSATAGPRPHDRHDVVGA